MTNIQKFSKEALIRCVEESINKPHHNLYICIPESANEQLEIVESTIRCYRNEVVDCIEPEYNECFLILKSSSNIFITYKLYDVEVVLTYSNFLCAAEFYDSFEIIDEVE